MSSDEIGKRRPGAASLCSGHESESSLPSLALERELWGQGLRRVAGVDEVGRGCVAGPVIAAACILPPGLSDIPGVRDSKRLTAAQRARLAVEIERCAVAVALGGASRREVDRLNVRVASLLAMQRALARLGGWDHALYDGLPMPEMAAEPATAVVGGDATCLSIACAAIVAKVARDALMERLGRRHPEYGWERNMGYGTAAHLAALREYGPTPFHRTTFAPVRDLLAASAAETRS